MDSIVDLAYVFINLLKSWYSVYADVAFGKFTYCTEILAIAQALAGSMAVYNANKEKPKLYWLHSLILVILSSFSGGIFTPILLGKPSSIVSNDSMLPIAIFAWYSVHYLGLHKLLNIAPVKAVHQFFIAMFRVHSVVKTVNLSFATIPPSNYYSIPLIGPILAGTISGCIGQFVTAEKMLLPITGGTPWAVQIAFYTSFVYHLMIHDTHGIMGQSFRRIIGSYTEIQVVSFFVALHTINLISMVFLSPETNLLTPLHKVLYLVFQVTGPVTKKSPEGGDIGWNIKSRFMLERGLEVLRVLFVLFIVSMHITSHAPPSSLPVNTDLYVGDSIGTCHFLSSLRNCQPQYLTFESAVIDLSKDNILKKLQNKKNALYRFAIYNSTAVSVFNSVYGNHWTRNSCGTDKTKNEPVWTLEVAIDASTTNRDTWKQFCDSSSSETASSYPVSDSFTSTQCASSSSNNTAAVYSTDLDPLDWGSHCAVISRLTSTGALQVLLVNSEKHEEKLLWQNKDTAVCDTTEEKKNTAGRLIITSTSTSSNDVTKGKNKAAAVSSIKASVTCSKNKIVHVEL